MKLAAPSVLATWVLLFACGQADDKNAPDAGQSSDDAGAPSDGGDGHGGSVPEGGAIWPSGACQANTAALLAKMTRLQKAQQMVMANDPPTGDVTANAPGGVFAPGGGEPSSGTDLA